MTDVAENKSKPFVRKSSAVLGKAKLAQQRSRKGLGQDAPKHEELYLDYYKKQTRRDAKEDEVALQKDPEAYTF